MMGMARCQGAAYWTLALVALLVGSTRAGADETIVLRTGQGPVGTLDPSIHFLAVNGGPFGPDDFNAARQGSAAAVSGPSDAWISGISDAQAQWIAVDADMTAQSALYAQDFLVSGPIGCARLDLSYAVDNNLGYAGVPGLYINGQEVPGSPQGQVDGYAAEYHFSAEHIEGLLHPGVNTLYFFQYDYGIIAGTIYSAQIRTNTAPAAFLVTQEPAPVSACSDADALFSVQAVDSNGQPATSYQWQAAGPQGFWFDLAEGLNQFPDWGALQATGVQASTVTLNAGPGPAPYYQLRCVVGDGACSTASDIVQLTVLFAAVTWSGGDARTCTSGEADFFAPAAGSPPFAYRWLWLPYGASDFVEIAPGLNHGTDGLAFSAAIDADTLHVSIQDQPDGAAFPFYCEVSNACGQSVGNPGTLWVESHPTVVPIATVTDYCSGVQGDIKFGSVSVGTLSTVWQIGDAAGTSWTEFQPGPLYVDGELVGQILVLYAAGIVAEFDHNPNRPFRGIVTDDCGSFVTDLFYVDVHQTPQLVAPQSAVSTCLNNPATCHVEMTGDDLSIGWLWMDPQFSDQFFWAADGVNYAPDGQEALVISGSSTDTLTIARSPGSPHAYSEFQGLQVFCFASGWCYSIETDPTPVHINSPDFNGDGALGTDADIEAFFACLGGDCCPTCGSADFNGDGAIGTDADIESFFRVLGGGSC
jgi:hypothetical protein